MDERVIDELRSQMMAIHEKFKMLANDVDRYRAKADRYGARICALERRDSKEITLENIDEIYRLGFSHAREDGEIAIKEFNHLLKKFGIKEI